MTKEVLIKANELNRKIELLEEAMGCFEWTQEYGGGSRNPTIIIQCDGGDGRENHILPDILNVEFIDQLKAAITKELKTTQESFDNLITM